MALDGLCLNDDNRHIDNEGTSSLSYEVHLLHLRLGQVLGIRRDRCNRVPIAYIRLSYEYSVVDLVKSVCHIQRTSAWPCQLLTDWRRKTWTKIIHLKEIWKAYQYNSCRISILDRRECFGFCKLVKKITSMKIEPTCFNTPLLCRHFLKIVINMRR